MDKVLDQMSSYAPVVAGLILVLGVVGLVIKVVCKQTDDPAELFSYGAWVGAMCIIVYAAYETQSILIALIGAVAATIAMKSFQGGRE